MSKVSSLFLFAANFWKPLRRNSYEPASFSSTQDKWTLHEHLLFQRRLYRVGVAVMSEQKEESGTCRSLLYYLIFLIREDFLFCPHDPGQFNGRGVTFTRKRATELGKAHAYRSSGARAILTDPAKGYHGMSAWACVILSRCAPDICGMMEPLK